MTQSNTITNLGRRGFLKSTTGAALAVAGTSLFSTSVQASENDPLAHFHGGDTDNNRFWHKVRNEFVLNKRTTYMNIGTAGTMPKRVLRDYNRTNKQISINP